jgi:heat shock protein HslJ
MKLSRWSPLSRWSLSLLVAGALVASGCGDDDPVADPVAPPTDTTSDDGSDDSSDDGGDDGSIDGEWVLRSGSLDGEQIELVDGWDVTMNIDGDQIGGTAACNGYGGTVAVGDEFELDGSFVVGELSWTEMGCEASVMDLEQRFLRALGEIDSYELADTLSLASTGVGTSLTFERVEPVDDTELVGVTWVLDTLITGDAASNSQGMDAAFVEFSDDGRLTGSTGCRRLEGEWSLDGATIQIPTLSAIDDPTAGVCSPESEALDGDIIAVIESGATAQIEGQIEGNRLTLMAPGGDGLSFTADAVDDPPAARPR